MAVDWGSWEYSGGNGMRVGVDVSVEAISHSEGAATFTVDYWTENQFTYGDSQTLNLTGSIGGSIAFSNNAGGSPVKRGTRTYTYNYSSTSYGSSPGSRTFGCTLSGAYNGVTPSSSHTTAIPARPYAAPAAPTAAAVARVTDTQATITWVRHSTSGAPYNSQTIQVYRYGYDRTQTLLPVATWTSLTSPSSTATTYTHNGTAANNKYQYRVRGNNSEGSSAFDTTGGLYTTPSAPTCTRTDSGSDQLVAWTNTVGYTEYSTEIWHASDGVWETTPLATVPSDVTSYLHVAPGAGVAHTYKVRNKTTYGGLFSAYSPDSTDSGGVTGPPNPPTDLSPDGVTLDPGVDITFTWTHNPVSGSAQTQYGVRYREQGASVWIVSDAMSSVSAYVLPADTFAKGQVIEWQVMTWGVDPTGSPWSDSAVWSTSAVASVRYPVYLDLASGVLEADHRGAVGYYSVLLPAGTALVVPQSMHGLRASRGLQVQVMDEATGIVTMTPERKVSAGGDVTITFSSAVAANAYRLTITG